MTLCSSIRSTLPTLYQVSGRMARMIDCHFHLWTTDHRTRDARRHRAEQIQAEADALGVDQVCVIGPYALAAGYPNVYGRETAPPRESNDIVASHVAEYPDLCLGWAQIDPRTESDAVSEFRRAVEDDGLIGLKHHFLGSQVKLSDPLFDPIAEAAVDMGVPILEHVLHRLDPYPERYPNESYTEDVTDLAARYPNLTIISAHIAGGGDWEYRIKNVREYENVYLDISGSVRDAGIIEMAAEYLGPERLVFGTDTWFTPGVGKLKGCSLSPAEKAQIAYRIAELIPNDAANVYSANELADRRRESRERFRAASEPVQARLSCANAFIGEYAHRDHDASANQLIDTMDTHGVDQSIVSATEALLYRNVQAANRRLNDAVAGHRDRLVPIATINPTYAGWRDDLTVCLEEYGMHGVKLLPAYHDYDLDDPAVESLFRVCADRDVPVFLTAVLEDQRQRHPRVRLRGFDSFGVSKWWSEEQIDQLIDLLRECPHTDVVIADTWTAATDIATAVTHVTRHGVRLDNFVRDGATLFVLGDLNMYFTERAADIVETIGTDHLVFGPKLPFKNFHAAYEYVKHLPVDESILEQVRHENLMALFECAEE